MIKFGSLFSGIGGFDLGLERAGMSCAWQCEIDKKAGQVLETHWPHVRRYTDVRQIGYDTLEPVDLICGGFPCQDLSVAGKRAGLAGGRSGLWWEFHRILGELLPRWVIIENVPGLLSSHGGRDMGLLLGALAQLGYGWAYRVLDAQYFGVAQRRRRVFIVGCLGDWQRAAQVLFERESGRRDTPPRREKGQSFAFSAGQSAKAGSIGWREEITPTLKGANSGSNQVPVGFIPRKTTMPYELDAIPTMHAGAGGHGGPAVAYTIQSNDGGDHKRADRPNGGLYVKETDTALTVGTTDQTLVAFGGNNTQGALEISTALNAHGSGRYDFESETFIAGTLPAEYGKSGGNGMGEMENGLLPWAMGVRRLTPSECERLQGFPDGWTENQADTQRYKQLGNAVAVPVAAWIGKRIAEVSRE